jgi:hypothetical protein
VKRKDAADAERERVLLHVSRFTLSLSAKAALLELHPNLR